jgi:hypothetical protein
VRYEIQKFKSDMLAAFAALAALHIFCAPALAQNPKKVAELKNNMAATRIFPAGEYRLALLACTEATALFGTK